MQKIMFNDRFLLTDAVLQRRKTQTRRIIKYPQEVRGEQVGYYHYDRRNCRIELMDDDEFSFTPECYVTPRYEVGEVVAVAQSYKNAGVVGDTTVDFPRLWDDGDAGYLNKMFVKSELMPHQIIIMNVRIQRLQEITDEECLLEGVREVGVSNNWGNSATHTEYSITYYDRKGLTKQLVGRNPKEVYSILIDKIHGYGTWESNPWVFVYDFELVK